MHDAEYDDRFELDASWAETLDRIRAFVASRVGNAELAADITQDVCRAQRRLRRARAGRQPCRVALPLGTQRGHRPLPHPPRRRIRSTTSIGGPTQAAPTAEPNQATRDLVPLPATTARSDSHPGTATHCPRRSRRTNPAAGRRQLGLSVSGMKSRVQRARATQRTARTMLHHRG